MNNQIRNYNIEDTGELLTRSKGGGRTKRMIIAAVAVVAVIAIALTGWKLVGDKRYNDQIEIAEKEFIEGNYEQAEAEYLKAIAIKKREPKAREGLAYTYAIQGKKSEAINIYNALFEDTNKTEYKEAASDVENSDMPNNPALIPAKGTWREIEVTKVSYYQDLENFIDSILGSSYYYYSRTRNDAGNFPSDYAVLCMMMDNTETFGMSIEDRQNLNEDESPEIEWAKYIEGADPRKWTERDVGAALGHMKCKVDQTNEYTKAVFNVSDEDISTMLSEAEANKEAYIKDGFYYYTFSDNTGAIDYEFRFYKAWTDGNKFCIQYDEARPFFDDDPTFPPEIMTQYALVEPKLIDGKHYWSIYYNGIEMPDEIKGVAPAKEEDPVEEPIDEEPVPQSNNTLVEPANIAEYGNHGYVSSTGGLNLRYGPGTNYEAILVIPDGAEAIEKGWNDAADWVYIDYNGTYGWVKAEYFVMAGGKEKPVIYLYPTKAMDVNVKVTLKDGRFTETIPKSANGTWYVTAEPNGRITDKATGKKYDYIFWESSDNTNYDWSRGYVVAGFEAEGFLKRTLPKIGLNIKEAEEFTEYWLPRLQKNRYSLVTFQTKSYTDAVKMQINPRPDSTLRVFMAFKEISKPIPVAEPIIMPFERKGFTVVEWGGAEVR